MSKTSKIHRNSTVAQNEISYIWKIIRKIQSIHLYWFHACLNKLTCCLVQDMIRQYLRSQMSFNFEPLVQMAQTHLVVVALAQHTHFTMSWSCITLCIALIVFLTLLSVLSPLDKRGFDDEIVDTDEELYYLQKYQASKNPLLIPIQSHSLAPALFYYIRTTTIQLLIVAVVEPLILCMTCHCHSK